VTFYPGTDRPWKLLFETPEPPPDFKARAAGDDTLKELAVLDAIDEQQAGPEARLRALWNAKGVPKERQEAILADITAQAQPGAMVGPFRIGGPPPALPGMDGHLEAQRKAAGERQGESLTEKFNRPPADVSAKAGELERKGQLFRDTEASGQGRLF